MTNPGRVTGEVTQEAPRTQLVEDNEFVGKFTAADATPSILNLKRWKAGNTGANNVTFFDDGFDGKEISILGDGFTTVVHNVAKIKTNTAANKLFFAGRVYRFTRYSGIWVEDEDLVSSVTGDPPSGSVVTETAFGQASAVGVVAQYSRGDHTHGTPADPVPAHVALADPHVQYQKESEKGAASGYASLDAGSLLPLAQLPPHKATHQDGGADEISVVGLSGLLADPQTPIAHHARHEPGGVDPMAVDAAAATGSLRTLGVGAAQAAAGNDARLSDARTPLAHHATHEPGGGDPMAVDAAAATGSLRTLGAGATQAVSGTDARLSDARTPLAHKVSHQAGGADEISVAGLTGLLATAQTPIVHGAAKHDATVEATANKGVASGYASLDTDVKVPLVNLHVPVGDKDVGNISLSNTQYLLQYERITLTGTERLGLAGSTRAIVTDLHSKDDVIVGTPRTPSLSFKIPDGYVASIQARLALDKSIRATIQGLGQLIVFDDFGTRSRIVLAGRS